MSRGAPTVLIVPGLRDHVADHWQTLLAAKLAKTRNVRTVPLLGRKHLSCGERVRVIHFELESIDGPVILVAHSGGVIMLAHWAQWYQRADIVGALLAAPADLETPMPDGYPTVETLQAQRLVADTTQRVCPFPASSRRAAMIRWHRSRASSNWRAIGAARACTSAPSAI